MPRRPPLGGPFVLCGFADLCDAAWGTPCPPAGVPTVSPSVIGGVALPFPCPHCGAVLPQMADQRQRRAYSDPARGFSWCPGCRGRYRVDAVGAPLPAALPPGAQAAPCRVRLGSASWILDFNSLADDLDFLEAT